jgi:decaprenylphospho-beta-D-erythro-pentofuranosid-2-ulose 2-reductase
MTDAVGRFGRVLVLGGGSEIGLALVENLLRSGRLEVVLAARPETVIDTAALESAGAAVERLDFDALATEEHEQALAPAFADHDVDLVVLAFGLLGEQRRSERDAASAALVAATTFTGAVSALTVAANRLRGQGHGTIVVLSSVAAQVPRRSNYVYGAAKAGLDAFARGLQLAAPEWGIRVLVVRPGFVRTKMTRGLRPAPFAVDPARAASEIVSALRRGDEVVWVPRILRVAMWVVGRLPREALRRL